MGIVYRLHKNVQDKILFWDQSTRGFLVQIIVLLMMLIFPIINNITANDSLAFHVVFSFFAIYSVIIAHHFRWVPFLLGSGSVITMWIVFIRQMPITHPFLLVESVFLLLFFISLFFYQARRTLGVDISLYLIFLCLANYLILIAIYGIAFRMIHLYNHDAFNFNVTEEYNHLYMSLEVFASVGLGDMLPLAPISKALVSLCGITGQIYLAFFVAFIMGKYLSAKPSNF